MNTLQFAIDLGRALSQTPYGTNSTDLCNAATKIIELLGIEVDDATSLSLGLGYGYSDRRRTPCDDATQELMAKLGNARMRGRLYRLIMTIAHKYNWHYAPPIRPDGDTQLWCKWCGFRQTIGK